MFNKQERHYCATRRELAAVIFALKTFRPYLLGRQFDLRVDNQAVSFLMRVKNPAGQAARYLDFLADYEFRLVYRKGASNLNADSLSRIPPCSESNGEPCIQCQKRVIGKHNVNVVQTRARSRSMANVSKTNENVSSSNLPQNEGNEDEGGQTGSLEHGSADSRRSRGWRRKPLIQVIAPQAWETQALGWTNDVIRTAQLNDPSIGPAIQWVETHARPSWTSVEATSPMLRALWRQFESLNVENGMLYRSFYDTSGEVVHKQLVLPHEIRLPFLELVHNDLAGHLKQVKCVPHIIRRAWWYGWKTDLDLFIKCCPKCEAFHRGKPPKQAALNPTHSGAPGEKLAIDLQGPFPASNGYRYVLSIICCFSKFGITVPLRNKEAHTVAKALVEHVFSRFGLAHTILSDLGKEFENDLLATLTELLGITKLRTSGYRPQANAICEVWHRCLNAMFAKCVKPSQKDWSEWLSYITFCYNAAEHSSTKFPPFFIFTGRMPIWTIDFALPRTDETGKTVPEYALHVVAKLEQANEAVRANLNSAWNASSKWYDRKVKPRSFNVGDVVRVFYPRRYMGRTPKWQNFYRTEAVVTCKLNDATYLVKSKNWKEGKIVHVDKLRPVRQFQ